MSAAAPSLIQKIPRRPAAEAQPCLRLPEDRAFDVATINSRLAVIAERSPKRIRRPI
jgi:hypothetical protein